MLSPSPQAVNAVGAGTLLLTPELNRSPLRDVISAMTRTPEPDLLPGLMEHLRSRSPCGSLNKRSRS